MDYGISYATRVHTRQAKKPQQKTGFPTTAGKVAGMSRKCCLKKYQLYYSSCVNIIYVIVSQVRASLTYATLQEGK